MDRASYLKQLRGKLRRLPAHELDVKRLPIMKNTLRKLERKMSIRSFHNLALLHTLPHKY